ncbi:MAG: MFS transporter [Deltaproteobacteria bacterium]|nr:MFS transporter [Deltaproteobacteria bacterium]
MNDNTCPAPEPFGAMIGNIIFLTVLFFLTLISRFIFAPLMPILSHDLGLTHSQAGAIFLISACGNFIGAITSGIFSSKINHRGTLILSTGGVGIIMWVFIWISSVWAVRMCVLFLGIVAGFNLPSNVATITAIVRRQDWGKALAVQQQAPPLSTLLGPLVVVMFVSWFSWRTPFMALGSLALIAALAFMNYDRVGNFPGAAPRPSAIKALIRRKSIWTMVILFTLAIGGQIGVYTMLPLYLVAEHGLSTETTNMLIGLSRISGLFMTFFAGWMTDRLGEKRTIALVLFISGIATMLLGLLSGRWLTILIFLQPALITCYFPSGFAALSRVVQPNMRSLASGLVPPTAFLFGGGLLPAALGYMGQSFTFGLGITLFGMIICLGSTLVFTLTLLEKMDEGC